MWNTGGLDVPSKSTSSIRQKFEPLLQIDDLKSIQWSTKTCCLLSDIWKCKMCSWGGIAGRCMKARTANRAVRTYKKNKAKTYSVSISPLLSYHYLDWMVHCRKRWSLQTTLTFNSQDFMSNSLYSLPYNLCDDSLENMELDQPIIP